MPVNSLYAGFKGADLAQLVVESMNLSGYKNQVKIRGRQDTATMCYFGSWTINNLPILFEICVPDSKDNLTVVFKYPVASLRLLIDDSIRFILTRTE